MEATTGFEPVNTGFANPPLSHLGTSPTGSDLIGSQQKIKRERILDEAGYPKQVLPLSAVIIARNEEDRIADAIESVSFADEIVVLDSGSTDDTVALAKAAGAHVVETDWPGHVAQKNRATQTATHDWVLSIDADERISPALAEIIQAIRVNGPKADGYRFPRLSWWQNAPIRHGTWYPDCKIRLFDRRKSQWTGCDPHDHVEVNGVIVTEKSAAIHHRPYRNLSEHIQTMADYTQAWAESAGANGVRAHWWDLFLRPPLHFLKAYLLKVGFLDGYRGFALAWLGSTYVFIKWLRLATNADDR